jgi:hypothetical protein
VISPRAFQWLRAAIDSTHCTAKHKEHEEFTAAQFRVGAVSWECSSRRSRCAANSAGVSVLRTFTPPRWLNRLSNANVHPVLNL